MWRGNPGAVGYIHVQGGAAGNPDGAALGGEGGAGTHLCPSQMPLAPGVSFEGCIPGLKAKLVGSLFSFSLTFIL